MPSLLKAALLTLLGTSSLAAGHMDMLYPPPFKSKFNPFAKDVDNDMTAPLSASGANYPCKGYHSLLGTAEGASVATFAPGGKYNLTIDGKAYHLGGSCQASLSYDKGKTFTVIQSWVGSCPTAAGGTWDFTVPADAPTGKDVLFAWTWFNEVGNREMYMNCASVTVAGGGGSSSKRDGAAKTPFASRPALFTANIGNGCTTQDSLDVIFPQPGPDVTTQGSKLAKPTGTCQAEAAGGSGGGAGSGSGTGSSSSAGAGAGAGSPTATAGAGSGSGSTTAQAASPTVTNIGGGAGAGAGAGSSSAGYVSPTHPSPSVTSSPANTVTSVSTLATGGGSGGGASFTPLDRTSSSPSVSSASASSSPLSPSSGSLPGGVFITVPGGSGGASVSGSVPAPTTLATSTTAGSGDDGGSPTTTTAAANPAGTGTAPGAGTTGGSGSSGSGSSTGGGSTSGGGSTLSGSCADEGAWNCIGGTSFQRCASGSWSAPIAMAAGTSCKPGVSDSLWRRSSRVRRGMGW